MAFFNTVIFLNFLLCLTIYTTGALAKCPFWKSCSDNSKIKKVDVAKDMCQGPAVILTKGTDAYFEVDFESEVDSSNSTSVCHGILGPVSLPFPVKDKNGCDTMSPACPMKKGQSYKFSTKIAVKDEYPELKVVVKWEEEGDNGDIFCIEIPAIIKKNKDLQTLKKPAF